MTRPPKSRPFEIEMPKRDRCCGPLSYVLENSKAFDYNLMNADQVFAVGPPHLMLNFCPFCGGKPHRRKKRGAR